VFRGLVVVVALALSPLAMADEGRLTVKAGDPAPSDGHFFSDDALRSVFDELADRRLKIEALEADLALAKVELDYWQKRQQTMDARVSLLRAEIDLATAKTPGWYKKHFGLTIGLAGSMNTAGDVHGGIGACWGWKLP